MNKNKLFEIELKLQLLKHIDMNKSNVLHLNRLENIDLLTIDDFEDEHKSTFDWNYLILS